MSVVGHGDGFNGKGPDEASPWSILLQREVSLVLSNPNHSMLPPAESIAGHSWALPSPFPPIPAPFVTLDP